MSEKEKREGEKNHAADHSTVAGFKNFNCISNTLLTSTSGILMTCDTFFSLQTKVLIKIVKYNLMADSL